MKASPQHHTIVWRKEVINNCQGKDDNDNDVDDGKNGDDTDNNDDTVADNHDFVDDFLQSSGGQCR